MSSPDLAARTLLFVDVYSESGQEAALMNLVRDLVPGEPLYDDGEVLLVGDPAAPVVLAGHIDTVPEQENHPGWIEDGIVHGLGSSDMKGGIAVMVELARAGVPARYLFFTREELPVAVSPLPALFATGLSRTRSSRSCSSRPTASSTAGVLATSRLSSCSTARAHTRRGRGPA